MKPKSRFVRVFCNYLPPCSLFASNRNCSIPLLDLSKTSPSTTIPLVARRVLPTYFSNEKETDPKPTNNTTTASLMGVSIDHSFIFVLHLSLGRVASARSLSLFGYHHGGLKTRHRQAEGDQPPDIEPQVDYHCGALQDAPNLGRFGVGGLYCLFCLSWRVETTVLVITPSPVWLREYQRLIHCGMGLAL